MNEIKEAAEKNEILLPTEIVNYENHAHFAATNEVYQKDEDVSEDGVELTKKNNKKSKKGKSKSDEPLVEVVAEETPEL